MRELMKEGFTRDLLVVIALTVLLGASVTSGVAYAVNAYLAQQVTGVLGDLGEYDIILHVREESCDAATSLSPFRISSGAGLALKTLQNSWAKSPEQAG